VKKFIFSVLGGCVIGIFLAYACIALVPKIPFVWAQVFGNGVELTPTTITQSIQGMFADPNHYVIDGADQSIAQDSKVVYADLQAMKIFLYENGAQVGEYPIASIGREGTAWQTPLGQFEMSYKIKNHFSSIGHVYMPFSMHFFGNYFIHGWPYYPDGTEVAEGYSGGCIRLKTEDAEQVYDFVDKETNLVVGNSNTPILSDDLQYKIKSNAPILSANYLVVDLESGEVVASHNAKAKVAIGSFTKLMTALISLETLNQYQVTTVGDEGMKISEAIYPLLLGDSDDAALALGTHKNKSQYLLDMDTRGDSLGMIDTVYEDVTGDATSTISTLEDTYRLVRSFDTSKKFIIKTLGMKEYEINETEYDALHPLREAEEFVAGFADVDNAELLTIFEVDLDGQKKQFVIMVQGSADAKRDTQSLYEWVRGNISVK
jgi:hypothetical protein